MGGDRAVTPHLPSLTVRREAGHLEVEAEFDQSWEGFDGMVHGGYLATLFDVACSIAAYEELGSCVTRRLAVRYLRGAPLDAQLVVEVRCTRRGGRLADLDAVLLVEGRVAARATAEFAATPAPRPTGPGGG